MCAELARWSSEQPHVAIAREYKFMCSSLGQDLIVEDIQTAWPDPCGGSSLFTAHA